MWDIDLKNDKVVNVYVSKKAGKYTIKITMQQEEKDYVITLYAKQEKEKEVHRNRVLITDIKLREYGAPEEVELPCEDVMTLYSNPWLPVADGGEVFEKGGVFCPFTTKSKVTQLIRYETKNEKEEKRYQTIFKYLYKDTVNNLFERSMQFVYDLNYVQPVTRQTKDMIRKNDKNVYHFVTNFAWYLVYYFDTTIQHASKEQIQAFFTSMKKEYEETYCNYTKDILDIYKKALAEQDDHTMIRHVALTPDDLSELKKDLPVVTRPNIAPKRLTEAEVANAEVEIKKAIDIVRENLANEYSKKTPKRIVSIQNKLSKKVRDHAIFLLIKHYGLFAKQIQQLRKVERDKKTKQIPFVYDEFGEFIPCYLANEKLLFLYSENEKKAITVTEDIRKTIEEFQLLSGNDSPFVFAYTQKLGEQAAFRQIATDIVRRACEGLTAEKLRNFAIEQGVRQTLQEKGFDDPTALSDIIDAFKTSNYTVDYFANVWKNEVVERQLKALEE